jgi:RNA polymerase sigma-70 factor (ECF subfamily)
LKNRKKIPVPVYTITPDHRLQCICISVIVSVLFVRVAQDTTRDADDLAAVAEVLRGNTAAYREIVERHQQTVFRLAYSFLGNREDAKDATQEILAKAFRLLHTFSLEKRFLPWLYTVTMNQLRTIYGRRKKQRNEEEFIELQDETYTPADEVVRKDQQQAVRDGIQELPRPIREAVVLYYLEEMSVKEVATVLEISRENVKSRLFRGRKALRKILTGGTTTMEDQ